MAIERNACLPACLHTLSVPSPMSPSGTWGHKVSQGTAKHWYSPPEP